ncbi:MAG: hypothetical protein PVJ49_21040, partial [Acidobacteriota bacterium]
MTIWDDRMIPVRLLARETAHRRYRRVLGVVLSVIAFIVPAGVMAEPEGTARGFAFTAAPSKRVFAAQPGTAGFALSLPDPVIPAPAAAPQRTQSGSTAVDLRALREAKRGGLEAPQRAGVEAGLAW